MKVYPKDYKAPVATGPVVIDEAKRTELIAKANELLKGEPMDAGTLRDHLEHWCVYGVEPVNGKVVGSFKVKEGHKSLHLNSAQLKDIVMQVQKDNAPVVEVVEVPLPVVEK